MKKLLDRLKGILRPYVLNNQVLFEPSLGYYINQSEYISILTCIIVFLERPSEFELTTNFVTGDIVDIPIGRVLRLPKEISGLNRTVSIVHQLDGEKSLLLECKSKLASGDKDKSERDARKGTLKRGKKSIRLDSLKPEFWLNLSPVFESDDKEKQSPESLRSALVDMIDEARYSQKFSNKLTQYCYTEEFVSKEARKVSLYTLLADDNLYDYIQKNERKLTLDQRNHFARQLLVQMEEMHAKGLVHQDIKLPNILVYGDTVKICDYGLMVAQKNTGNVLALASRALESPEISFAHRFYSTKHRKYFKDKEISYGRSIVDGNPRLSRLLVRSDRKSHEAFLSYLYPHKANDMFSCGLVLYRLYFGNNPTYASSPTRRNLKGNSLVQGLLRGDRKDRLTASEALALFDQSLAQRNYLNAFQLKGRLLPKIRTSTTDIDRPISENRQLISEEKVDLNMLDQRLSRLQLRR